MRYLICSIIKNEHKYLAEWIEHNLSIGFTDIYLFEDFGSISHKDIVERYNNVHLITCDEYFPIKRDYDKGNYRQTRLYHKFLYENKGEGWCAFIDLDEFIELRDAENLDDLVKGFENCAGIAIPWEMYGANEHIKEPRGKVQVSYSKVHHFLKDDYNWNFKSFVNLSRAEYFDNLHCVHGLVDCEKNAINQQQEIKADDICRLAVLKHYFTKSFESYFYRMEKRGDLMKGHRGYCNFFEINADMAWAKGFLMQQVYHYRKTGKIDFEYTEDVYNKVKRIGVTPIKGLVKVYLGNNVWGIPISKCGCTTISAIGTRYLYENDEELPVSDNHYIGYKYSTSISNKTEGVTFSVYRDPIDRFKSMFENKVVDRDYCVFVKNHELTQDSNVDEVISFIESDFSSLSVKEVDDHIRRQVDYYKEPDVDYIVPIEYLDDFLLEHGIQPIEHQNSSGEYHIELNQEQEARLKKLYAADYELLKSPKLWKPSK